MTATLPRQRRITVADRDPSTLRVAVYLRQSQDTGKRRGEEEGLGIDRQRAACLRLADFRGWTVDPALIFPDNDVSASKRRERPRYAAMLAAIERREVDVVVAWAVDRLLRRPIEMERLIELCESTGVKIVTVQGDLDLDSPAGRMAARMFAVVARQEVEQKGERQHLSELQAVERGKPPRRRAFGYAKGGMTILEDEAAGVRDAYRMVLAGSSLASIAAHLNSLGLRTSLGREWEPTAVRTLLLNARNAAIRTYYGEETGPGTWPAIVSEGVFRQAAALLRDPERRTSGASTARKHLGAGLFRCGKCDAEGVDSDVFTTYRGSGERVYTCRKRKHLSRLAEPIDGAVLKAITKRLRRPDVADLLVKEQPELAALHDQAAVLRAKIRRIEDDYGEGEISARVMREQKARRETELKSIDRRLSEITRGSALADVIASDDPGAAFLAMDLGARRSVIDALCRVVLLAGRPGRAKFDPETIRVDWRE